MRSNYSVSFSKQDRRSLIDASLQVEAIYFITPLFHLVSFPCVFKMVDLLQHKLSVIGKITLIIWGKSVLDL